MVKESILESALNYLEKYKFSVIPANKNKKALIKWEEFQTRKATKEEIKEWWKKYPDANIAAVTGKESNLAVIDIDTEEGKDTIQEYIPDSILIPTCETPKGGQHLYFQCPDPPLNNNSRIIPGCDFRGEGGYILAPPSINDQGKVYRWLPGLSLDDVPMVPLPKAYLDFVTGQAKQASSFNNKYLHSFSREGRQNDDSMFFEGRRDNDLFHVTNCLVKGGMPDHEVIKVLEILAKNCVPPFPEKELKNKIESALKRAERRERNLAEEVRSWVLSSNGVFLSADISKCLQLSSREEQKNLSKVLGRLCDEELIQRYGNRNGSFRVIDTSAEEIDFVNVSGEIVDIKWPFQIEKYLKILPKNIIVIAGVSDAGKTALLLNFVEMNMDKHQIYYFSSEMGSEEFNLRLSNFGRPLNSWKFKPIERSSNFPDVIRKDAINIVDYLEIHDEFYKIGGYIKDIYDKLDKGIAIIAIQKNPGSLYGLGGARGLEKARLYMTIDNHKLKIEKGKNWVTSANPNGLVLHFKLLRGCHFIIEQPWRKETK